MSRHGPSVYVSHPWKSKVPSSGATVVSAEALADRERRRAADQRRDLTGQLMGDPPRAAEVRVASPSIVSDPLDGLLFRRVTVF